MAWLIPGTQQGNQIDHVQIRGNKQKKCAGTHIVQHAGASADADYQMTNYYREAEDVREKIKYFKIK